MPENRRIDKGVRIAEAAGGPLLWSLPNNSNAYSKDLRLRVLAAVARGEEPKSGDRKDLRLIFGEL